MPRIVHQPQIPPLTVAQIPIQTWNGIVEEAQGLFDNMMYYWDQLLFPRKFRAQLLSAWREVREVFSTYRDNMTENVINEGLRQVGFMGQQLQLKLAMLNDTWGRFAEYGIRYLKELLEGLSVCFDSLSKVFPKLKAVKEFVDFAKWAFTVSEHWIESVINPQNAEKNATP